MALRNHLLNLTLFALWNRIILQIQNENDQWLTHLMSRKSHRSEEQYFVLKAYKQSLGMGMGSNTGAGQSYCWLAPEPFLYMSKHLEATFLPSMVGFKI